MGTISRTSFSTGDIPTAAEWNTQFDTVYNLVNGNIDAINLNTSAVTWPKLSSALVLDEDTLSSDNATAIATQQSIKAYVDEKTTASALVVNPKGYIWGFDYFTNGSAASALDDIIISPGSINLEGTVYTLSAGITATPTGLNASASYYMFWTAPGSGTSLSSSDFSYATAEPTLNTTYTGYYTGSNRAFGFFRTNHDANKVIYGCSSGGGKFVFANDVSFGMVGGAPAVTNYTLAGIPSFLTTCTISVEFAITGSSNWFYSGAYPTSTTNDIFLWVMGASAGVVDRFGSVDTVPVWSSVINVGFSAAGAGSVGWAYWQGFDNPW